MKSSLMIHKLLTIMRPAEIAAFIGCDVRSIPRWENDESKPLPIYKAKISQLYSDKFDDSGKARRA